VSLVARAALDIPQGTAGARFSSGRVVFTLASGEHAVDVAPGIATPASRSPYHLLAGDILLALEDNNPLAMVEAHPDKFGNAIDLGGRPLPEWLGALRASLALVGDHLPALRAEMDLYLQQVVPVGFDAEKHLSASYREAIGTVYLTLHPSPLTMVEAIIHEFSHNKLNALFEVDDVLENAFEPLYPSPVRPDPRPLHGVLLAVHAFVPVARLYELLIEARHPLASAPSFRERLRGIVEGNHEGTEVLLTHARPTRVGQGLLDELARWDRYFAKIHA
jgi:HEXXH motif-containing protein